jgi:hypothetical protein
MQLMPITQASSTAMAFNRMVSVLSPQRGLEKGKGAQKDHSPSPAGSDNGVCRNINPKPAIQNP